MAKQQVSYLWKNVFLGWLIMALIMAPVANAQQLPNPTANTYPNCPARQPCGRMYVLPWVSVGSGFTATVTGTDNLPNDKTGKTANVSWKFISWYDVAPDGTVQYQTGVYVTSNGVPQGSVVTGTFDPVNTNGAQSVLDFTAPFCDYASGQSATVCPTPPPVMNMVVTGWAVVDDGTSLGLLAPPTQHQLASTTGSTPFLIYDHTESATWYDQGAPAMYAPVTVGGGKDCSFALAVLGFPIKTAIFTAELQDPVTGKLLLDPVTGKVVGQAVLPTVFYQQFQNAAYSCSQLFPNMAQLPSDKGTNARLVVEGIIPIALTVYQIYGGGGMGGNVGSQGVFSYYK